MRAGIFIGVDPGPTPGIAVLVVWGNGTVTSDVVQCTAPVAGTIVRGFIEAAQLPVTLAVERFVVGRASMRSSAAGAITRDLVGQLQQIAREGDVAYVERSASEVKPWATDDRLAWVRLLEPTKGMRHARDGARHALFAAVKDGGLPDPLSKRGQR